MMVAVFLTIIDVMEHSLIVTVAKTRKTVVSDALEGIFCEYAATRRFFFFYFSALKSSVWIPYYENKFETGPAFVGVIIPFGV